MYRNSFRSKRNFSRVKRFVYRKQRSTISSGSFGKGIIASGFAGCGAIHFSIQIMSYQRSNLYAQAWKCPTS